MATDLPPNYCMPSPKPPAVDHYKYLIIGAGQGGALARMLCNGKHRIALIEKAHVGGTCINIGCTPTKALAYAARVAYLARRSSDYGVCTGPVSIDMPAVRQRKRELVQQFRGAVEERLDQLEGVDLIMGTARFCGSRQVEVQLNEGGTLTLEADTIIIAAGMRAALPPVAGLHEVPYLNAESLMELEKVPQHLLILGGGYIALEFEQMFCRFGAAVTIIEQQEQLLAQEDADIAHCLTGILYEDGIQILLKSEANSVRCLADGTIEIRIATPDGEQRIQGSHLLVATGQKPNTDNLDLEAAGVQCDDKGYVVVNDKLETNVPGIYALGDIKGGPAFTHIAYDDARLLCANLSEDKNDSIAGRLVPYTIFTDPQLGRVGLSEREARKQGYKIRIATLTLDQTARGDEAGETRGLWKVIVEEHTNRILGGAFLSIEGGEIMAILQVAMMGKLPYTALRDGVFSHPTLAESFNNLFLKLDRHDKRGRQQ